MSYRMSIDEYSDEQLQAELRRREVARNRGQCDYCFRASTETVCKFPDRHSMAKQGCADPGYGGCMPTCDYCRTKSDVADESGGSEDG